VLKAMIVTQEDAYGTEDPSGLAGRTESTFHTT
jgi:hypothetical protein